MQTLLLLTWESCVFALQSLWGNKLRSLLSLLGITIGIFAIITVFTMIDSMKDKISGSINELGSDVIYVQKWPWEFGGDFPWWKYYKRPLPKLEEVAEVEKRCNAVAAACFTISGNHTLKFNTTSLQKTNITGITHNYNVVKNVPLNEGRYFTNEESQAGRHVAIIGSGVAGNLFGQNVGALGKDIKIQGVKYTVIAILTKQGESIFDPDADNKVYIPLQAARSIMNIHDEDADPCLYVLPKKNVSTQQLKDELTVAMRSIRRIAPTDDNNFALNESSLISKGFDSLFDIINVAGTVIGGFSILVGCFGVANIMFVSVRERTPIIGIQKSLGAKNYFILVQFIVESIILCVLGGIVGIFCVGLVVMGVNAAMDMHMSLSAHNITLGLGISVIIGVIAGVLPAIQAAKLDPVEAIRMS
ncbi:MAG: ABC transporter permease [Bacteroidia bacterium]